MCSLTRTISEECLGAVPATGPRPAPLAYLSAVRAFNCFFETTPVLLESNAAATTLLYRNVSYLWQDVVEQAGVFAAQTPLRLFGTTEHRETAEMDFFQQDTVLMARRRSASGREFDHLQGLALQAQWPDAALAQNMTALALSLSSRPVCCAVSGPAEEILRTGGLLLPTPGSLFGYLTWQRVSSLDLLLCLGAAHQTQLWTRFLTEGRQSLEFDWLWSSYYRDGPLYLLEWELTLRTALAQLGFHMEQRQNAFRLLDRDGHEQRFDFARGGPAEKLALKLLFPLDDK